MSSRAFLKTVTAVKNHAFGLTLGLSLCSLTAFAPAQAQVNVLTQRYDNSRSGRNLHEKLLNVSNVNVGNFGRLFSRDVDGEIYAQPLLVSGLTIPGKGKRNVVFVATEHNSVYAFDADNPEADQPFWHRQMGPTIPVTDVGSACGIYKDFSSEIGITGTPVIDPTTQTLYVVARTKIVAKTAPASPAPQVEVSTVAARENEGEGDEKPSVPAPVVVPGTYHQYLHALDIRTGKERVGSPVEIKASVVGKGTGSRNGILTFDPRDHNQRPGLLLHNGVVYICWGGHCDTGPYHGWIIGYNAKTLKSTGSFCTTPNGLGAGIWQSGVGPMVDSEGHLCFVNGNGTVDTDTPALKKTEYGSSFLKLQTLNGKITVADWFTPYNFTSLNEADLDTGSTSIVPIPGTQLMVAGSKAGVMYVLNAKKMGGFDMFGDKQIVQKFPASKGFLYSTPVVWQREGANPWLYSWGMDDRLKAFQLNQLESGQIQFDINPVSQSNEKIFSPRPGGFLSLSAHGFDPKTGILWALQPNADANQAVVPGTLRAFDASDLSRELWNSSIEAKRDDVGLYAKFCPPIVANGHVYVASFSNQLHVYGLNPPRQAAAASIRSRTYKVEDFVTLETDQPLASIRYTMDGSNPTSASTLYRTPFLVPHAGQLKVRAFAKGELPSPITTAWIGNPGMVGEGNGLLANYFPTKNLTGDAVLRLDTQVKDNPRPPSIPEFGWSARWTGQILAPLTGTFTFTTNSDDGVRLWVGGKLLIDDWNMHGAKENSATIDLEAGQKYPIRLEYFQDTAGATYQLFWTTPGEPKGFIPQSQLYTEIDRGQVGTGDGLKGSYFETRNLEGPAQERIDPQVNDGPHPERSGHDNWSVRWTGQLQATHTGTFTISTVSDDGVRLWLNGRQYIDDWNVHGAKENNFTVDLQAGQKVPIVLEYFQGNNAAICQLLWKAPGGPQTLIPQSQLYSQMEPGVTGTGTGLAGAYFANTKLEGAPVQTIDAQINNNDRPQGIPEFNWSARWTGQVQATHTGTYTISTITDDGARLWLDGKLVINDWNVHGDKENKVTLDMVAGEKHSIRLEYFQGNNGATRRLLWTTPVSPQAIIPQRQLYPETDPDEADAQ